MNYSIIKHILGKVLMFEALFMLLPCIVALIYRENAGISFLVMAFICFVLGFLMSKKKPENQIYFAKEGFVIVASSWIVISIFGAIPFVINGDIPFFIDALFETISGFTTTGASILSDVESLSKSSIFWRSFTHWIGGMGVLVFLLAIMPMSGGYSMHLMRAESPGPSVGKLVPRIKDSAKILYTIYFAMTVIQIVLLLFAGMPVFDAITTTFGTAGTGGFGIKNSSMGNYSILIQGIVTVFMILFGVNFNAYYLLLGKNKKEIFKLEEVKWYFIIVFASAIMIAWNIRGYFSNILLALHHSFFQVGSIITTTGFSSVDFNVWPQLSRNILVILMFIGACAGSTGGGIKVSRIIILYKMMKKEIHSFIHPRGIRSIRLDYKAVEDSTAKGVGAFFITYTFIFVISLFIISLDNFDMVTNFTAVAATFNNIGPGLELVGPASNYGLFSPISKLVLMFDMLAGRLELYPMLVILMPGVWKKRA